MLTRDQLIRALPIIREALDRCSGGSISGDPDEIVLTIRVDAKRLFEDFESALRTAHQARTLHPQVRGERPEL